MSQLVYDHNALVEPNLLIPGKKPVGPVRIDEDDLFAKKRAFFFHYNIPRGSYIDGNYKKVSGGVIAGGGLPQDGLRANGSSYSYERGLLVLNQAAQDTRFESNERVNSLSALITYTYFVCFKSDGFVSQGSSINTVMGFGSYSQFAICVTAGEALRVYTNGTGGADYSGVDLADGYHTIAVVNRHGAAGDVYIDGIKEALQTNSGNRVTTSSHLLTLGGDYTSTSRYAKCKIKCAGVFSGEFSGGNIKSQTNDPYQFLISAG